MKVVLFDAYNLLYRAKHSTPRGMMDSRYGITYMFFRSFAALYRKLKPDIAYFVLEGIPVRRLALAPDYKGTRVRNDDDNFRTQRREIIDLIASYFPIKTARHPEYECDDVIAHLVKKHVDDECIVVSNDTDLLQLANSYDNFQQYNPIKKDFVNLPAHDYVSWKALRGDSSDNIPGFRGIGDKRAMKLILNPALLDDFLNQEGHQALFEKNIELIRFHNISKDEKMIKFSSDECDWPMIKEEFMRRGFTTMLKEKSWNTFIASFGENYGTVKS